MWQDIVITIVSAVVTALASWIVAKLSLWINTKIKNGKLQVLLNTALSVVENVVKATYQTYVEGLKGTDAWTADAQKKALQMAMEAAKEQIAQEAQNYITEINGDLDSWLTTQIEATIYSLKNANG